VYAPLWGVRRGRRRARDVRRTVTTAPHTLRRSGRPSPNRTRSTTASPVPGGTAAPACTGRPGAVRRSSRTCTAPSPPRAPHPSSPPPRGTARVLGM